MLSSSTPGVFRECGDSSQLPHDQLDAHAAIGLSNTARAHVPASVMRSCFLPVDFGKNGE